MRRRAATVALVGAILVAAVAYLFFTRPTPNRPRLSLPAQVADLWLVYLNDSGGVYRMQIGSRIPVAVKEGMKLSRDARVVGIPSTAPPPDDLWLEPTHEQCMGRWDLYVFDGATETPTSLAQLAQSVCDSCAVNDAWEGKLSTIQMSLAGVSVAGELPMWLYGEQPWRVGPASTPARLVIEEKTASGWSPCFATTRHQQLDDASIAIRVGPEHFILECKRVLYLFDASSGMIERIGPGQGVTVVRGWTGS